MITQEQKELLSELIDMDSRKHSWHINVYDADQKSINNRIKEIISEKMAETSNKLNKLYEGYELLESLKIKEDDKLIDDDDDYGFIHDPEDDLPF
jgi:hypothetical protein